MKPSTTIDLFQPLHCVEKSVNSLPTAMCEKQHCDVRVGGCDVNKLLIYATVSSSRPWLNVVCKLPCLALLYMRQRAAFTQIQTVYWAILSKKQEYRRTKSQLISEEQVCTLSVLPRSIKSIVWCYGKGWGQYLMSQWRYLHQKWFGDAP